MMKLFALAILAIATVSAFSSEFQHDLIKNKIKQAHIKAAEAINSMRYQQDVHLMDTSSNSTAGSGSGSGSGSGQEDMCAQMDTILAMGTLSGCKKTFVDQGVPSAQAAASCKCVVPMFSGMVPILKLMCGDCKSLFAAMEESERDLTAMCSKKKCFADLFDTLENMSTPASLPASCQQNSGSSQSSSSGSDNDSEQKMEENFETMRDGINFFCAKNTRDEYCGATFDAAGKAIGETCGGDFNVTSCVCPIVASQGCCLKAALNYMDKHDNKTAADLRQGLSTCEYDVSEMSACASGNKKKMKFTKQKLGFQGIICGKKKDVVAYTVQKLVASKAKTNVGNVAVVVDSCPCCSDGENGRRLLAEGDGELLTTVSISGDNVDTAAANFNKAVESGTVTDSALGGTVDKSTTTEAKVNTQSSDIGDDTAPAPALVPSVFVTILIVAMATLF